MQTITDLTAAKLISRNRAGLFQQDVACAHGHQPRGDESPQSLEWGDAIANCPSPPQFVMFQNLKHQIACIQCSKIHCLSSLYRRLVTFWTKLYSTLL